MKDIDLDEVYIYRLQKTIRQINRYSQEVLKQNGVTITSDQWILVKRISEQEGINQREIAGITCKDPASVTRIIDILEKNGTVKREPVNGDRRSYALYLTDAGKSLVRKVTPLAKEIRLREMKGIKKSDQEKLNELLTKIYDNVS
ncbi:MAG: MarR family transcriptional regulator [Flavobacteriales bacterium]|nr:MarR family transcriptional regulator [Flavobacteriales bacterium]